MQINHRYSSVSYSNKQKATIVPIKRRPVPKFQQNKSQNKTNTCLAYPNPSPGYVESLHRSLPFRAAATVKFISSLDEGRGRIRLPKTLPKTPVNANMF